jgi:hypothetical protein
MTKDTDSLNAFNGLSRALEKPFSTTFFQGLPLIFFDIALCFETPFLEDAKRRGGFPSWSWCGWDVADGVSYEDFEEKTLVFCKTFYHIQPGSRLDKNIIPICAENIYGEFLYMKRFNTTIQLPTISNTILDSMSNVERENLLVFETLAARLFVSTEDDGNGGYIVRTPSSSTASTSSGSRPLWTIGLDPLWPISHGRDEPFDFIEVCRQYKVNSGGRLLVLLVEKDGRGISQRVQMCAVSIEKWMEAKPAIETVYLL